MIDTKGDGVTRRWSLQVTGVLLGCLLVGCSAEQEASGSLPSSSAAPTTEQELPPLGPEDLPMPDEARTRDAAGAEAFVRYYIDLINRTSETLDPAPLRELSDGCVDCNRIAADAEADAAAGYSYVGGALTVTYIQAGTPNGTVEVSLVVDQAELQIVNEEGIPVEGLSFPARPQLQSGATANWDSEKGSWIITGLTLG